MNSSDKSRFIKTVYSHYETKGRHSLPWRINTDPYYILVSELMLQQTQVDRVIPKFTTFVHKYPSIGALYKASIGEVLLLWQGLGYNRRAKYLLETAALVQEEYNGVLPQQKEYLLQLPGVGTYTAAAVQVFGFNIPEIVIETNIRTVYISHFYNEKAQVSDEQIKSLLAETLDYSNPREWYWALMDYGSYIKKTQKNYSRQSSMYKKQSAFKGSNREIRGAVIKLLVKGKKIKNQVLALPFAEEKIKTVLKDLVDEGLVTRDKDTFFLA